MKKVIAALAALLAVGTLLISLLSDADNPGSGSRSVAASARAAAQDAPIAPDLDSVPPQSVEATTRVREVAQPALAQLLGTVLDGSTGQPLPAVPLVLTRAGGPAQRTVSDAGGRFGFEAVEPGTCQLKPEADGDLDYQAEPLELELTADTTEVELTVERAWFLRGIVVKRGSQLPAGGVHLVARIEEGGTSSLATTEPDGSFRSSIAFTATTLHVRLSQSATIGLLRTGQQLPDLAVVEVGGEDVTALVIELPWTGVLHGVVLDHLSRPIEGAVVRVLTADSIYLKTPSLRLWARNPSGRRSRNEGSLLTGPGGRFRFEHLPVDQRLALIASASGFAVTRTEDLEPPFVADRPGVEIRLDRGGAIAGQVLADGDAPIENAMVTALRDGAEHQPDPSWTDEAGDFTIGHLEPGTYQVSAEQGKGMERRVVASGQAEVVAGEETTLVLRAGVDGARFSGVAVDQNGQIITADLCALKLRCRLDGASYEEEPWRPDTPIEEDGSFDITVAHTGRKYRLSLLSGAAGDTWETQVVEAPATDLRLTFTLMPLHTLTIRALDQLTGERIERGNMSVSWGGASIGMNFSGGERSIPMREGTYRITVDAPGYAPLSRELSFVDTSEPATVVELRLGRGRKIDGIVLDAAGRPAKGHSVVLMDEGGLHTASLVYSGADGRFTLTAAPLSGGQACVIDENYRILTRADIGAGEVVLVLPDE